jgi:integrase
MNTHTRLDQLRPQACFRIRAFPVFAPVLDDLLNWFQDHGYTTSTIRNHIQGIDELIRWLKCRHDFQNVVTNAQLNAAYNHFQNRKPAIAGTIRAIRRFLSERDLLPQEPMEEVSPSERQLELFAAYLRDVRGLAETTIEGHQNRLRSFLHFLKFDQHPSAIQTLDMPQIEGFVRQVAKTNNRFSLQHIIASLRAFLRRQHALGVLIEPLHQRIDTPRVYRLEQLPQALPWKQVVALLRSIDRSTSAGLRDFTLLYLAARYGLRSSELVRLTLDDIDWRAGTLNVSQTKTRQVLQLPLTEEAGDVLVQYLRRARPDTSHRELFLRRRAPVGVLKHTATHDILEYRIRCSGLGLPSVGCHALRHSFAVHLLRQGVSMPDIGGALGHRDPQSTTIYLRLAVDDLRTVGLPVPMGAKPSALVNNWEAKLPRARLRPRPPLSHSGFHSNLAASLRDYLEHWRALGRLYKGEEDVLRRWDDFLQQHYPSKREVSAEMFQRWASSMPELTPTVLRWRLRAVRKFLIFHARLHPKTYLVDPETFPKCTHCCTPRLVSAAEMARVLATAEQLPPSHTTPLRAKTIRLALLLLFCCGLRRGELLRLELRHYDTEEGVLQIEASKFHKSRLVPLSPSVDQEVRRYLQLRREHGLPLQPESPLIWSCNPLASQTVYSAPALASNWQALCLSAGVLDARGRAPRIHDLRHSFAVAALHRWYRSRTDIHSKLPHLATYMGHVSPVSTYYYLSLTPDLRQAASRRFHQHASSIFGGVQ